MDPPRPAKRQTLALARMEEPATEAARTAAHLARNAVEDLPRAMVGCFAYGDTALIERAVEGTEVAVIGSAEGGDYYYVSPCNACASGFVPRAAISQAPPATPDGSP